MVTVRPVLASPHGMSRHSTDTTPSVDGGSIHTRKHWEIREEDWPPMLRELIGIAALAMVVGFAVLAVRSENAANHEIARLEAPAARTLVQDGLIGRRIELASLAPPGELPAGLGAGPVVLWFLDMEICADCFDNLGPWSRLETLEGHRFLLVHTGTPTETVRGRLRSLTRTQVVETSPARIAAALGRVLPNTKLLIDEEGIVVLADGRHLATECGWSFEAQLGALEGLNSSHLIRGVPLAQQGETQ